MYKINENIFHQYNKWKEGYTRKENSFKLRVQKFLSNRKDAYKFKISEDGEHIDAFESVKITDNDISDGKFIVPFGKVDGNFNCNSCDSLRYLVGAPKEVEGYFSCANCTSLKSLEGAPKEIGNEFICAGCISLTSLVGAPDIVDFCFNCNACTSLTSLVGAPEEVYEFYCYDCGLTTLEGLPKLIRGNLHIDKELEDKIPDDVIIKGKIDYV